MQRKRSEAVSGAVCDERSEGTDGAKGPRRLRLSKRSEAVSSAVCDERSEGTEGAAGTRRLQRRRSEAMSDAVM
jgi:hypothetical protein